MSRSDYRIETPTLDRIVEALRLVFCDLSEEDREARVHEHQLACSDREHAGDNKTPAILLGCFKEELLCGAVLARVQRGKTAVVWPPRFAAGESLEIAVMLHEEVDRQLARYPLSMANVLLDTVREGDDEVLSRAGFERLATLLYMLCPSADFSATPSPGLQSHGCLDFEAYNKANHARFSQIVDITYNQTLDCPRLNGIRSIEDVLEGYRDLGRFDPANWFIVCHQGEDVGCLILADYQDYGNVELVYMGIIPSKRGHGWGREVAQHAKSRAASLNRPHVVLAVDADNRPAIDMYVSVGFHVWEKRIAYAKFF